MKRSTIIALVIVVAIVVAAGFYFMSRNTSAADLAADTGAPTTGTGAGLVSTVGTGLTSIVGAIVGATERPRT